MFSRFCNLCHRSTNVQLRQYYKKGKRKSNVSYTIAQNFKETTPIITCKQKQFNFYEGQIYPKDQPVPLVSKGWHHYKSKGDYFFIQPFIHETKKTQEVIQEEEEDTNDTFMQFNLDPRIVKILEKYNITKPVEIQKIGIPKILNGSNTVIAAETGCGKTLAYLLPMINNILKWKELVKDQPYNSPFGLIVVPTRELAYQIGLETKKICQYIGVRTQTFIGGKTKKILLNPPVENIDIVIGSFGIISKLTTNKVIKLNMVKHIVLDEADALFHDTFEEKLQVFLKRVPLGFAQNQNHIELPTVAQFTIVSATMPSRMSKVLNNIINVESLIPVSTDKLHHILVPQKFMRMGQDDKPIELLKYIKPKAANKDQVIIFSNNNITCNWVSMFLDNSNVKTVCLHGDIPLYHRQKKYSDFKSGRCRVLCTTNAGSRGLDTISVHHVLNYEFPTSTADYIHRCGRTGRINNVKDCRVTNFISGNESELIVLRKIERATRKMKPIPIFNIHEDKDDDEGFEIEDINQMAKEEFSIPY